MSKLMRRLAKRSCPSGSSKTSSRTLALTAIGFQDAANMVMVEVASQHARATLAERDRVAKLPSSKCTVLARQPFEPPPQLLCTTRTRTIVTIERQHVRVVAVMRQLILNNIDVETAERLELRAKRLGTTPEEEASRLLRERLRMEQEVAGADESGVDPRFVQAHGLLVFSGMLAADDVPDHRELRDERTDALLKVFDEGRV